MFAHMSKTASPSGALAAGRISTVPSPVARSRSHRSTSSVHGSNSPEPRSAIDSGRVDATGIAGGKPLLRCRQPEELGLHALAEDVIAEGVHHSLDLADVRPDRAELQLDQLGGEVEVDRQLV